MWNVTGLAPDGTAGGVRSKCSPLATSQAFGNVLKANGPKGFWAGLDAKLVESASKGSILLVAKV